MKVPIRVYNHVAVDVPQMPYNLLAPTVMLRDRPQAKVTEDLSKALGGAVKSSRGMAAVPSPGVKTAKGSLGDLRAYAARLLASAEQLREDEINGVSPTAGDEQEREGEGTLKGCREAVEILTRVPKKISYDVNKDGVKVAVLTFTKSAYRLGETVLGVVELNERSSRARVLKLSAMLEAHESLPSSLSSASDARHMRRVHAEYHSSFVLSSLRTTFTLDIPSDASPAFQLTMGEPPLGGLEWKVRLCLLVAVAAPPAAGGKLKQLVRSGIRGEWGSSWVPTPSIAPLERPEEPKPKPKPAAAEQAPAPTSFWSTFFTSTFVAPTASGFHDGDDLDDEEDGEGRSLGEGEVDLGAGEEGWRPVRVETVECEVPVKVWPGNTAFRAVDVVFDV
ncbi:hypothetical protein DENSPDRAFT_833600 [Dentipellis sp. KUC8613]|nr:hypothetical protein DENSPDRAFT_833600 [Dentipellis sp. KUC8613]